MVQLMDLTLEVSVFLLHRALFAMTLPRHFHYITLGFAKHEKTVRDKKVKLEPSEPPRLLHFPKPDHKLNKKITKSQLQ